MTSVRRLSKGGVRLTFEFRKVTGWSRSTRLENETGRERFEERPTKEGTNETRLV